MSEIIKYFNIFPNFPQNIKQNIKSFYVSRDRDNQEFEYCVTNDDKVYGFGQNIKQILGYNIINIKNTADNYVLITELCDQNIQEFYEGDKFMFARNDKNQIFSWGWNWFGQLARVYSGEYWKPDKVDFFDDKNIINITCDFDHCLALSSDGLIWGWGDNRYGNVGCDKEIEYVSTPVQIEMGEKIKFILCAWNKSFALSFDGNIYFWGNKWFHGSIERKVAEKRLLEANIANSYLVRVEDKGYVLSFCRENRIKHIRVQMTSDIFYIHRGKNFSSLQLLINFYSMQSDLLTKGKLFNPIPPPDVRRDHVITVKNVNKLYYSDCREKLIILNENEEEFEFNPLNDSIFPLKSEKSNDTGFPELIKSDIFNFFGSNLQKARDFKKSIEIKEERYFVSKEIQFNKVDNNLILIDKYIFKNYLINFEETRELGSGSFGYVFEVKGKKNDQKYAIKKVELTDDESGLREVEIMSELNSDFVVKYFDSWIEGNVILKKLKKYLFIQMELCPHNLRHIIELLNENSDEKLQINNYLISYEIFKQLIECVNYLHSIPIIHRDLKPENILISDGINGRFLKLCDFGLAKFHEISNHTRMVGTLQYMAPEVLNSGTYNTKSDIYSLALIGTEIFRFEDKPRVIKELKNRKDFDKYLSKYLNTSLEKKFRKLLEILINCLLPKSNYFKLKISRDYHSRPDCRQLLDDFRELSADEILFGKNEMNLQSYYLDVEYIKNLKLKNILSLKLEN